MSDISTVASNLIYSSEVNVEFYLKLLTIINTYQAILPTYKNTNYSKNETTVLKFLKNYFTIDEEHFYNISCDLQACPSVILNQASSADTPLSPKTRSISEPVKPDVRTSGKEPTKTALRRSGNETQQNLRDSGKESMKIALRSSGNETCDQPSPATRLRRSGSRPPERPKSMYIETPPETTVMTSSVSQGTVSDVLDRFAADALSQPTPHFAADHAKDSIHEKRSKFQNKSGSRIFGRSDSNTKNIDIDPQTRYDQLSRALSGIDIDQVLKEEKLRFLHEIPINRWTVSQVGQWLEFMGLDNKYVKLFRHHKINGFALVDLTEEHLRNEIEIIKVGHRIRIMKFCKLMNEDAFASSSPSSRSLCDFASRSS